MLAGIFTYGNYYVSVPALETALEEERKNSTREKVSSKSLKSALGKTIALGKRTTEAGAKDDDGNYYICVPEIEDALGWRRSQAREKLVSKSLESFAGNTLRLVKKRDNRGSAGVSVQ